MISPPQADAPVAHVSSVVPASADPLEYELNITNRMPKTNKIFQKILHSEISPA